MYLIKPLSRDANKKKGPRFYVEFFCLNEADILMGVNELFNRVIFKFFKIIYFNKIDF